MKPDREPLPIWYERDDARKLLRACAETPPPLAPQSRDWREGPRENFFDRNDNRVFLLHRIVREHFAEALREEGCRERVEAAGLFVSVDQAIDAVLDRPRAGCCNDPGYLASLPRIDLSERAAA